MDKVKKRKQEDVRLRQLAALTNARLNMNLEYNREYVHDRSIFPKSLIGTILSVMAQTLSIGYSCISIFNSALTQGSNSCEEYKDRLFRLLDCLKNAPEMKPSIDVMDKIQDGSRGDHKPKGSSKSITWSDVVRNGKSQHWHAQKKGACTTLTE